MALSTYSRRIVLVLTNNMSTTVMMTVFQLRNAFEFQHEVKNNQRLYTCIASHCQRVPTFADQLHDLSTIMRSDGSWN